MDSIQLFFEDSGRILGSLSPYLESRDFGAQIDPVPVGFDAVLSAYRELAEDTPKAKYVLYRNEVMEILDFHSTLRDLKSGLALINGERCLTFEPEIFI